MGRAVEPVFAPIGWDWKVAMAVIASFPAREVVVGTLGVLYDLAGDDDESTAPARPPEGGARGRTARKRGQPVFDLGVGAGAHGLLRALPAVRQHPRGDAQGDRHAGAGPRSRSST